MPGLLKSGGALACGLTVALAACGGAQKQSPEDGDPLAGARQRTPVSLTLPRLGGGDLSLDALRGKPVLVTLFTTWSLRCQAEAPLLLQLQDRYPGLQVVGISIGPLGQSGLPLVQAFVEVTGITYPVLLAEHDNLDLVGAFGQVKHVPRTVLLDAAGRELHEHVGQTDFPKLYKQLDALFGTRRSKRRDAASTP